MVKKKAKVSESKKQLFILATVVSILLILGMALIYSTDMNKKTVTFDSAEKYAVTNISSGDTVKVTRKKLKQTAVVPSNPITLSVRGDYKTIYDDGGEVAIFKATKDDKNYYYVYCIQLGVSPNIDNNSSGQRKVNSKESSTYWNGLSSTVKNGIMNTTIYGFNNNSSIEGNEEDLYIATQTIIWEFQQGWRTNYDLVPSNKEIYSRWIEKSANVKKAYESILTAISNSTKKTSFAQTSSLTLEYNEKTGNYEGKLTDSNKVLSNFNVTCSDSITCTVSGNTLNISSKKEVSSGTIKLTKSAPNAINQNFLVVENGNYQQLIVGRATPEKNESTITVKTKAAPVEKKGQLKIAKLVTNGKSGYENTEFKFEVTGPNNYSEKFTLKARETKTLDNLEYGLYTVKEVDLPSGYKSILPTQIYSINRLITKGELVFTNVGEDERAVSITKTDENGNILAGATLSIRDKKTNLLLKKFTTKNEPSVFNVDEFSILSNLDVANIIKGSVTYKVCEEEAPKGYVKSSECVDFKFSKDDYYPIVILKNVKEKEEVEKKIVIDKVDSKGNSLKGATLQLVDPVGTVVEEWNESSHVLSTKITKAGFKVIETKAPDGYMLADPVTIQVPTENTVIIQVVNDPIELTISKRDTKTNKLLKGAHLQLLDKNSNIIDEWDTTDKSHVVKHGLKSGETYTLKETVAPKNYSKAQDLPISIDDNGSKQSEIVMYDDNLVVVPDTDISASQIIKIAGCLLIVSGAVGMAFILKKRGALE